MRLASTSSSGTTDTRSVASRASRAAAWLVALRVALVLVGIVEKVILARVLTPRDFGLMGICLLTLALIDILSQTGFVQALIHERTIGRVELDSVWVFSTLRGIALGAVMFATAGPAASFFHTPEVQSLQRVLALVFVLDGLSNPAMVIFRRELTFTRTAAHQLSGVLVEVVVGISLALALHSVWALVAASVARYATQTVASYVLSPYRPRPSFDLATLGRLARYGRWVTVSGIVLLAVNQGDDAIVARLMDPHALGLYQLAFVLASMPATEITNVLAQVAFPAYVKVRDAGASVGEAYLRVLRYVTFLTIPLAGGIFILAPDIVSALLGSHWREMVPTLQILAVFGLIRSIGGNSGPLFQAVGRPDLTAKTSGLRLAVMVPMLIPMTRAWGIEGAALAVLLSAVVATPVTYALTIRLAGCGLRPFVGALVVPVTSTAAMVLALLGFERLESGGGLVLFGAEIVLGVAVYAAATAVWVRLIRYEGADPFLRLVRQFLPCFGRRAPSWGHERTAPGSVAKGSE